MAALSAYQYMNLAEANKRAGYDDSAAVLGELQELIDVLKVIPWRPSTHGTFNRQFQASRLGAGSFSTANSPVNTISSTGDVVEEPVKLYEGQSLVDERVLQGVDDPYAVRDSEDAMNLEGAIQDWSYNLFYGSDGSNPDNFQSFSDRRNSITNYPNYVFSGGGSGSSLTSAWLLELSPQTLFLAYPSNSGAPGLHNEDRGRIWTPAPTGSGNMYAWARLYQIWAAIVVRNARSMIRYCNIASSGSSNTFSITDFVRYGKNQLQNLGKNAFVFVNRNVKGQLEAQAYKDTQNGALTFQSIEGMGPMTAIAGIPVLMHEGITTSESALS